MRLPIIPLLLPAAVTGALVWRVADWEWVAVIVTFWFSFFLVVEWVTDAIVREIRRARLRG